MKNFGIGLALGLIGAMIWYAGIVLTSFGQLAEAGADWQSSAIKYGGFGLMVAGPVVYWIILPIIELVKRRREN